jgi:hypothetical protein
MGKIKPPKINKIIINPKIISLIDNKSKIYLSAKFITREVGIISSESLIIFSFGSSSFSINLSQILPRKDGQYQKKIIQ